MSRILVVDDIDANRYLLTSIFKGTGHEVAAAENGAVALALALKAPPELIVTDILMPVMDGFELCRRWKADERLKAIPFVFYTATYTDPKDEQFALSLGAERFLIKPQKPEVLMKLVAEVLEEARRKPPGAPPTPPVEDAEATRRHEEALFRKLEKKVLQLEAEIAERERVQGALRESQERLLEAQRLAHMGIWRWDAGTDTMTWSEELHRIAGTDPRQPAPDRAELRRTFTQESWERLDAALARTRRTGEPFQLELELVRADGSRRWINALGGAKHDESGQVVETHGTVQDITERRHAEEALRLSEERFRALIEKSTDMILVLDAAGAIRFWSPSATEALGWAGGEVLGRPAVELIHPDDQARVTEVHLAPQPGDATMVRAPLRFRHKDGSWRHIEASARNLLRDPAVEGVVMNCRDVTGQRLLEEQLRQAQKLEAVGRLAGGIAHDFNNILAVMNSYAELAVNALQDNEPVRSDAQQILKAGERAARLTRQILAFSRKQVLQPVVLNLNTVVSDLQKMLRRLLGEDVDLRMSLAADLGNVRADSGQIEQVLMNLIVNARDAMPKGGRLTIETVNTELDAGYASAHPEVKPGAYVTLVVSDSGCGMDPATLARIFEPFFTTKRPGEGTGLGLSTVYGIVKQSDGHVSVYSEPGRGTTFRVYLPREATAVEAADVTERRLREVTGHETVMVVEDQEDVRALVERILGRLGYRVLVAPTGRQALRLGEELRGPIDLLLTDVVLPEASGPELAARLLAAHSETRVLFMSGYANEAVVQAGGLPSSANFISKPFTATGLAQKVREVLGNGARTASRS